MSGRPRLHALLALVALTVACQPPPTVLLTPIPTPSPTPRVSPSPGRCQTQSLIFDVADGSTATVRVKEILAWVNAPFNEAVVTSHTLSGVVALDLNGGFDPCSLVVVDLENMVNEDAGGSPPGRGTRPFGGPDYLDTADHPFGWLVPVRASGLPSPLPESGTWSFQLESRLTLRGVTKDVRWDATLVRTGATMTARAHASVRFEDFGMTRPDGILSLEEQPRIDVMLNVQRR